MHRKSIEDEIASRSKVKFETQAEARVETEVKTAAHIKIDIETRAKTRYNKGKTRPRLAVGVGHLPTIRKRENKYSDV